MECKWDISKTLDVHTYSVYSLAVLDERLASGSNEIIIWNSTDWTQIHYYRGHSGYVTCILTLPNNQLASADWDANVHVWNTRNYTLIKEIKQAHSNWIYSFILIKSAKILASA